MVVIVWNIDGFHVVTNVPKGQTYDSDFASTILNMLDKKVGMPMFRLDGKMLHWDNSRPHKSLQTQQTISNVRITQLPHPPYSPDIAPSDFFLFGYLKKQLKGMIFHTEEMFLNKIMLDLRQIDKQMLIRVFEEWIRRLRIVISSGGEYFIK